MRSWILKKTCDNRDVYSVLTTFIARGNEFKVAFNLPVLDITRRKFNVCRDHMKVALEKT